jgi:uncharacterized protein (DUF1501 family)
MAISRRTFLKRSVASAAALSLPPLGRWLPGTGVSYAAGPTNKSVVFVQLFGGNDGVNTVYPLDGAQRSKYEEVRPTLQLPKNNADMAPYAAQFGYNSVLDINTNNVDGFRYALNPGMGAFHQLYGEGKLAVVNGVHYPFADYSHFRSMAIWWSADPLSSGSLGWFGRYMRLVGLGPTVVPAVMVGGGVSPMFIPTSTSLFAFFDLYSLTFPAGIEHEQKKTAFQQLYNQSALTNAAYPELLRIGQIGAGSIPHLEEYYKLGGGLDNAGRVEALLLDGNGDYDPRNPLVYNSPLNDAKLNYLFLARDLKHVAATIRANVGACFFHVGIGGFDTHANQEQDLWHSSLLYEVSESVTAFYRDMEQTASLPGGYNGYRTEALANEVLIVLFSEFGRTVHQNATHPLKAGTDHATSAPMFVLGGTVQGGQYGAYPSLDGTSQDGNDLYLIHDLRDVFGTVAVRWLNFPLGQLLGSNPTTALFQPTNATDSLGKSYTSFTPVGFLAP